MAGAEERGLELRVRSVEGGVVPVEASARLGGRDEEGDDDAPVQRLGPLGPARTRARAGPGSRVRPREDLRRRLACELLERDHRILALRQTRRPRLDEAADERPVLVERRPAAPPALLAREGGTRAGLHLPREPAAGAAAETAQRVAAA